MKRCSVCKQSKEFSEFYKSSRAKTGVQSSCKPCHKSMINKDAVRKSKAKSAYGLSPEVLEQLEKLSGGLCTICDRSCPSGRRLAIDHDHKSGTIRGLLCINCNKGLGNFKDNVDLLNEAITYLSYFQNAIRKQNEQEIRG